MRTGVILTFIAIHVWAYATRKPPVHWDKACVASVQRDLSRLPSNVSYDVVEQVALRVTKC